MYKNGEELGLTNTPEFTHLHVHSDFSLLDSSVSTQELAKTAAQMGMKAMALTDHGNTYGLVQWARDCTEAGIKPIFGMEAYVARRSAKEEMDKFGGNSTDHLVLLAENEEGYKNLMRLSTIGWEYENYFPRIDLDILAENSGGLIAQTACLSGGVNRLLIGGSSWNRKTQQVEEIPANYEAAKAYAVRLKEIFGPNNFFMEVQHHCGPHQDNGLVETQVKLANLVLQLSKEVGVPLVGTNDIHFAVAREARARHIALMISRGKTDSEKHKMDAATHAGEFYIKTPAEMAYALSSSPELLVNTMAIAERCNYKMDIGTSHFPKVIHEGRTLNDAECQQLWEQWLKLGFLHRFGDNPDPVYVERLRYEKGVIEKMGFVPYFLVIADFIKEAKRKGIPVGPGRGSVGGCMVAYVLSITGVNPMNYDLLFERFLNPDRISMPDIDIDFCKDSVGDVLDYLIQKYGKDRVARITTYGNLWAKSAIRDVGRILELPVDDINDLANSIPAGSGEHRVTLDNAVRDIPKIAQLATHPDPKYVELLEVCKDLEGIKRAVSTHACGVVIGDQDLRNYVALRPVKENEIGGLWQTQADMDSLADLGLVKMDILPLATLTIIARTMRLVETRTGTKIDLDRLEPYDDPKVYQLASQGRATAGFQVETNIMRELLMRVQPTNLEELAAVISLNRPGPMDHVDDHGLTMVDHYVLRRIGREAVSYLHPTMEAILKPTNGIIIYQEQAMKIAVALCGYTVAQADLLRKAMGKKKPEIMAKEGDRFVSSAVHFSKITVELAKEIWGTIETFARYGFNKSHAITYGVITYWTLWLKQYYPLEFMVANLTNTCGESDKDPDTIDRKSKHNEDMVKYIDECYRLGIEVLGPDVQKSQAAFTIEGRAIRCGLAAIKGVGKSSAKLVGARALAGGKFGDYADFVLRCTQMKVTRSGIVPLINCGACDSLGDRMDMLASLNSFQVRARARIKKEGAEAKLDVELPEQEKELDQELATAEVLDLLGTYVLPRRQPNQVGLVCSDSTKATEAAAVFQKYKGKGTDGYLRVTHEGITTDFRTCQVDGSLELLDELDKYGTVHVS